MTCNTKVFFLKKVEVRGGSQNEKYLACFAFNFPSLSPWRKDNE